MITLYEDIELRWQVDYFKAESIKGSIIADMMAKMADQPDRVPYTNVKDYASFLFNIAPSQAMRELSAYRLTNDLLQYAKTDQERLRIQTAKESQLRAIPSDTDPEIAIKALMDSTTAKEVKAKLVIVIQETQDEAEKLEAERLEIEDNRLKREHDAKKLREKEANEAKRLLEIKQEQERVKAEVLTDWRAEDEANEAEYQELRSSSVKGSLSLDGLVFKVDNDLYEAPEIILELPELAIESQYAGDSFEQLTREQLEALQAIDDKIRALILKGQDIFTYYEAPQV